MCVSAQSAARALVAVPPHRSFAADSLSLADPRRQFAKITSSLFQQDTSACSLGLDHLALQRKRLAYHLRHRHLCVPKISSTSCDQVIFVDQATDVRLFPDAVLVEIDRLW